VGAAAVTEALLALSVAGIVATVAVRLLTASVTRRPDLMEPLPSARGRLPRDTYR
jgi:hypothetical protein